MSNIIIICPTCGAEIEIEYRPEYDNKSLTCRECHVRSAFTEWGKNGVASNSFPTPQPTASPIGKLIVPSLPVTDFQLREGINIIGRGFEQTKSQATIKIPINADPQRTSREHIIIEVSKSKHQEYTYTLSLYKEAVNKTAINNTKIGYGDRIKLKHGDVIHLPDVDVIFELSNNDCTEFYTQYE